MAEDNIEHSGGCLCGNIRYTVRGAPRNVSICHCRNCQKNTGTAFSVNAIYSEDAIAISGELSVFEDSGDSGEIVRRYFCANCGTPIRSAAAQMTGFFVLKAGTLDEPSQVVPTDEIYCDREVAAWKAPIRRHRLVP